MNLEEVVSELRRDVYLNGLTEKEVLLKLVNQWSGQKFDKIEGI
jgi:hypothetical protein